MPLVGIPTGTRMPTRGIPAELLWGAVRILVWKKREDSEEMMQLPDDIMPFNYERDAAGLFQLWRETIGELWPIDEALNKLHAKMLTRFWPSRNGNFLGGSMLFSTSLIWAIMMMVCWRVSKADR